MLVSCQEGETTEKGPKLYFDLRGFIENQIVYLNEKRPEVMKTAILGSRNESTRSRNIDWKKELELFIQADLNKPSYRQSYDVIRTDSLSYEYRLKKNIDLPVKYLKIVVDTTLDQPVYVEALLKAKNKIYESEKKITLECVKKSNLLGIANYSVKGYQKLIYMDDKPFSITSKIGL